MNKKNLNPEYWQKILNKPIELTFKEGQTCEGILKKADEKSLTIREVPSGKILVFELDKVKKIQPLELAE